MYQEYIEREVIKETANAYMVKQEINNRRDGQHTKFKWVAKSICKPMSEERKAAYDAVPDEYKKFLPKFIMVPEWAISNGVW